MGSPDTRETKSGEARSSGKKWCEAIEGEVTADVEASDRAGVGCGAARPRGASEDHEYQHVRRR